MTSAKGKSQVCRTSINVSTQLYFCHSDMMLQHGLGFVVLLLTIGTLTELCSTAEQPKLLVLERSVQGGGTFCPGETAWLKCIFPEGEQALLWYVSGIKRPFDAEYLSDDLPGHSTELFPEGNYTIVKILKEEAYKANYSCAVDKLIQPDVLSNSVDITFEGELEKLLLH